MFNPQKIRPPLVVLILYVIAMAFHFIFKFERIVPPAYLGLGAIIFLAGLGIMLWAHQLFTKHKTSVRHDQTPIVFVLEGPYRFTRNPMYVGGLIMFLGIAVMAGTWPFLAVPVVMLIILDKVFIPWEERTMTELFKDEYRAYLIRTRRWI